MDISSRKQKYKRNTKSESSSDGGYLIPFELETLRLFCSFILSENSNIRKSSYINMRNLFSVISEDSFGKDDTRLRLFNFIKRGLDARVIKRIDNPYLVLKFINGGLTEEDFVDPKTFDEVSNEELKYINETVSACIKNSYINDEIDTMESLCLEWKTIEFRNRGALVSKFEELISKMQNKFRKVKVENDASEMMFSLKEGTFDACVRQTHADMSKPSNKLSTGMQGLNEMLSGGLESGRCYCLFGLPGEGKTTTLLNLAVQIKKHNKHYKTKDPKKRPCIVFLTQENSIKESINSLFNISVDPADISDFNVEEALRLLRTEGELMLDDESPIDIIMKYKPINSVDTSYLYELTEDLEDDGYEAICVLQDYIKRIRPVDRTGDIRIDYGNVINDFKTFATLKDIPVVTASQLNREATKHIDEGRKAKKSDLVRLLGRSNIGESMLILENIDAGFMLAPEMDKDGNKYLGIQRIKARYKKISNRESMYQPFVEGNLVKLVEDEGAAMPAFKESLRFDSEQIRANFGNTAVSSYHSNSIKEIETDIKLLHSDDSNIFINATNVFDEDSLPNVAFSYQLFNPIYKMVQPSKYTEDGLINVLKKCRR